MEIEIGKTYVSRKQTYGTETENRTVLDVIGTQVLYETGCETYVKWISTFKNEAIKETNEASDWEIAFFGFLFVGVPVIMMFAIVWLLIST